MEGLDFTFTVIPGIALGSLSESPLVNQQSLVYLDVHCYNYK